MAAWHYSVNLLPTTGVVRVHGCIPRTINVPRVTQETIGQVDAICDALPNYWLGIPVSFAVNVETQLASWLPEATSWSPHARMFGDDDTCDQLFIWRDDAGKLEQIRILISLSGPDPDNLARLLAFPALNDCLFHGIQSESVYAPTLDNLLTEMSSCSAARFLRGRDYFGMEEGDHGSCK